jgi:iron complex transport system ATP-binding protein
MSLAIEGLTLRYASHTVVEDVRFHVAPGEIVALLGPNGAGKTTLFRALLGAHPIASGRILLDDRHLDDMTLRERARRMAYVPQIHHPPFPFPVIDTVALGRLSHLGVFATPGAKERAAALEALVQLGAEHLALRAVTELSGGERQRVLLARALCQGAPLLLLDEPTAHLDFGESHRALETVRALADQGHSVLWTSHDPDQVLRFADRAVLLAQCRVRAVGVPGEVLDTQAFSEVFGVDAAVGAVRLEDGSIHRRCIVKGSR